MNTTTNFNLKKPEGTDFYNVEDFNDNADIIDAELLARIKTYTINTNTDVNTLTTPGVYTLVLGATYENLPNNAVNGWLWVLPTNAGAVKQIFIRFGSRSTYQDIYQRLIHANSNIEEWAKIATETDLENCLKLFYISNSAVYNLNDYTDPGIYYFPTVEGSLNLPGGSVNGWLMVMNVSTNIKQVFFRHGSAGNYYQTFVRLGTNGVWHSWVRYATEKDIGNISTLTIGNTEDNLVAALEDTYNYLNGRIGKELTATLTAGATTLTFTDSAITTNSTIYIESSVYGLSPNSILMYDPNTYLEGNGGLRITFDAQSSDVEIKVVIK